ncbi:hypothetical protein ACQKO5_17095 [Novosphingobium subterraneum]|uniref:hypothetical protein n=1 Tax=Novosphingobium subterraneum TaxID=48936 RepID=UPI003D05D0F8
MLQDLQAQGSLVAPSQDVTGTIARKGRPLREDRRMAAKRAFTTRRVDLDLATRPRSDVRPRAGDLVLARGGSARPAPEA